MQDVAGRHALAMDSSPGKQNPQEGEEQQQQQLEQAKQQAEIAQLTAGLGEEEGEEEGEEVEKSENFGKRYVIWDHYLQTTWVH